MKQDLEIIFERALERVDRRISDYRRSPRPDTVLSEEAFAQAAELWQSAQPANLEIPTLEDNQRLAAAREALGWLHFLRRTALPEGPEALSELARAVLYFAPVARELAAIPEPLQALLGADADVQANVAAALGRQALTTIDPVLVDAMIWLLTTSISATPRNHPDRVGRLSNLGLAYQQRFVHRGVLPDLELAIETHEEAVAATPGGHPGQPLSLSNLGLAYQARFAHGGVLADLDLAIESFEGAVAVAPAGHPNRPEMLSNLGNAYRVRYGLGGALADLDQAIELGAQAIAITPDDHPQRPVMLSNLGTAYRVRFERGAVPTDLDQAVELGAWAVAAMPRDHPHRAVVQLDLSIAYRLRYVHGGMLACLQQAIETGRDAVAAVPDGHPDRAVFLANLGAAYECGYECSDTLADLDQAIESYGQAVAATPDGHPHHLPALSSLGNAYRMRFEQCGVPNDLDRAIELCTRAATATPHNYPSRAVILSRLGIALHRRFERGGVLADLERAVETIEEAVAAAPHGRPERAAILSNLGIAYKRRYERGGISADIEQAIEVGMQAVAATPDDHVDRARWLFNVGVAYLARFERNGVLADLDLAVEVGTQAVAATPDNHAYRAVMTSGLGLSHRMRFELTGLSSDIEQAIEAGSHAVAATPNNHPNRAMYLSGLGLAYLARFEHNGVMADADLAIEAGRQAAAATPDDHPLRAGFLSNLGNAHRARFEHSEVPSDIEQAIQCYGQAVDATADDHADRAKWLFNLGNALRWRMNVCRQGVDSQTLLTLARQVTAATTGPPVLRVRAEQTVGSLAHAANEHSIAVELLDAAVGMLPTVAPREAGWADQELRLGRHLGLAGEAVAAHCAIDDPVGAVEAAELSRGILLAAQLDSRSDLTDLAHAHPDMAAEFRRVRDHLNAPETTDTSLTPPLVESVGRIEHRKRLWAEYDQLLDLIRQQPSFADFLLPPRLADLQRAVAGGAVILVNSGSSRCDAIIITAEAIPIHVPLLDLKVGDIASRAQEWLEAIQDRTPVGILRRQRVVPEMLDWLWDAIVERIIKRIPPASHGTYTVPRVWWLPTGPLGLFPLHAAGHIGHPGALDAVISSYIPTLRALSHARTRPPAATRRQLTVALHHTPGLPDLPGTVAEATALHSHRPDTPLLLDEAATTSRVLNALPNATWAHFACHASANLTTPSRGGLALYDSTLALPDISQLNLEHAELAYLSACSTAYRGVPLADESLHLASAFQLAGFRHVVASLWPLNDRIAATAADAFYRRLPDTPTADHAAITLHHVVRELRDEHSGRPDLWAALIHSGP